MLIKNLGNTLLALSARGIVSDLNCPVGKDDDRDEYTNASTLVTLSGRSRYRTLGLTLISTGEPPTGMFDLVS